MIPKYRQRSYILDKLHRGTVYFLLSLTAFAAVGVVYQGFCYYYYVKPEMRKKQQKINEELLEEGKYKDIA